ncbi:MAG: UPF0175 family protein [Nanoarchaeota archaeon]
MTNTISVRLNKDILGELSKIEENWQIDRSESVRRLLLNAIKSWKIQKTLEDLREHKISIGKAAENCGISLWEIFDLMDKHKIDWTGYSEEDLEKDLEILGE